jgi:putative ABC transport system permease protein
MYPKTHNMILSFFSVAYRSFKSRKLYSFINIAGLSLSISIAALVYLFLRHEMRFDKFHVNGQKLYRLESHIFMPSKDGVSYLNLAKVSAPLIEKIKTEIPEIKRSTRLIESYDAAIIQYKEQVFSERITYVDSDFFSMFSFNTIHGSTGRGFQDVASIIITASTARKYFGENDPIGKIISVDDEGKKLYTVQAVLADPPDNSSIEFNFLAPVKSWTHYEDYANQLSEHTYSCFIETEDPVSPLLLERKLSVLVKAELKDWMENLRKVLSIPQNIEPYTMTVSRLEDIHWNISIPWTKVSNPRSFQIMLGIALIIIAIACINFVSLSLIYSTRRSTEVGVRKVLGATAGHVSIQFIVESVLYVFLSACIGLALVFLLLPLFNSLVERQITYYPEIKDALLLIGFIVGIGVLAGAYPALVLSSFNPAKVLKSRVVFKLRITLISTLVILQFSLSLFLSNCSFVMMREMEFINSKDLGFDREQVVILPTYASEEEVRKVVDRFRAQALQQPLIKNVSAASEAFFAGLSRMGYEDGEGNKKSAVAYSVDAQFIPTLGLRLLKGRNFKEDNIADQESVIINETLAGDFPSDPVGSTFYTRNGKRYQIIGVVKDFHFRSLEHPIQPLFLVTDYNAGPPSTLLIKISPNQVQETLAHIEHIWQTLDTGKPFAFKFMDNEVNKQYASYVRWTSIMTASNIFATFIACIGLFGLTGMNVMNKYHEIGIRKVMGARTWDIFLMINRQYFAMILISAAIGTGASYLVMSNWLKNFTYGISIGLELVLYGIASGAVITFVSVTYHAIKGSLTNPAETIRYE